MSRCRAVLLALPLACGGGSPDGPGSGSGAGPGTDSGTGGTTPGTTTAGGTGSGPAPTYYEDVAPITYANCVGCHREGSVAPFSLESYDETTLWGPAAGAVVTARTMPPIPADASGACNTFTNAKWLTDEEIQTINDWVAGGMQEGDPSNGPDLPPAPGGLSGNTVTLGMGGTYTGQADDDYRCFLVDPELQTTQYLTGFQVNPDAESVVHHVILYAPTNAAAETTAVEKDAAEAGLGYDCYGGSGVPSSTIAVWAPGLPATDLPPGTGIPLEPGRKLIMQIHYNTLGGAEPDSTTVDIRLEDTVEKTGLMYLANNKDLDLPPGEEAVIEEAELPLPDFPGTVEIWGVVPHMHTLGRKLWLDVEGQCLVDVPRWDFNWQRMYLYDEPIEIQPGDTLNIGCEFDTTSQTEPVYFGEDTSDEMCLAYLYVAY